MDSLFYLFLFFFFLGLQGLLDSVLPFVGIKFQFLEYDNMKVYFSYQLILVLIYLFILYISSACSFHWITPLIETREDSMKYESGGHINSSMNEILNHLNYHMFHKT